MPTPFGEISVPNIAADVEAGIGAWSEKDFYRALYDGIGRGGDYLYPVFPDRWHTKITRDDGAAIYAYLRTIPPVKAARPPLKLSFPADQGAGFADRIPPLTQNGAILAQGPQNVIRVTLGGLPATRGLAPMPAIGSSMFDRQVTDATNYIRNSFADTAPAAAQAGMVADLRSRTRTVLTGDPADGCPGKAPAPIEGALSSIGVQKRLSTITASNTSQVIDGLAPKLREAAGKAATDDNLVNALTDRYCVTLKSRQMTRAARSEALGNFCVLAYSQLRSNGHD